MPSFSQRKGLKPLKEPLQLDRVDIPLRSLLWSELNEWYFVYRDENGSYGFASQRCEAVRKLIELIWRFHFRFPSDAMRGWDDALSLFRKHFFECKWNEVYDLVEFVAKNRPPETQGFARACNSCLAAENSAYRLIADEIVSITSPAEIAEIEQAAASGIHGVEQHISTALALLADRKSPDYRNCIKESISAVETVCRSFGGGTTLANALNALKRKVPIHPAFERSLNALYGYTSDEGGIRHSLLEESQISFSDAKFMLVICSAFANYLIGKAAESGLKLEK